MNKERLFSQLQIISPKLYHSVARKIKFNQHSAKDNKDYDLNNVGFPSSITILPTLKCNLRCGMCWWWGDRGIAFKYTEEKNPIIYNELTYEEIVNILQYAKSWHSGVMFIGGEIFVRKDMMDILELTKKMNIKVGIVTNGTRLSDENCELLGKLDNLEITISIDGPQKIHDKIRGSGNYARSLRSIESIANAREKNHMPKISTNTTVTPDLLGNLHTLISELQKINGLDLIRIQHLWFTNHTKAEAHKLEIKREFGIDDDPGVEAHIIDGFVFTKEQVNQLNLEIKSVEQERYKVPFRFYPPLIEQKLNSYYFDLDFSLQGSCDVAFTEMLVQPDGTVKFCPDDWIADYKLGNLRDSSLADIWYGEPAKKFREVLLRKRLFPACNRCCHINM